MKTKTITFVCQCGRHLNLKVEKVRGGHRIADISPGENYFKSLDGQLDLFGQGKPKAVGLFDEVAGA